jgi:hypothetical protein
MLRLCFSISQDFILETSQPAHINLEPKIDELGIPGSLLTSSSESYPQVYNIIYLFNYINCALSYYLTL